MIGIAHLRMITEQPHDLSQMCGARNTEMGTPIVITLLGILIAWSWKCQRRPAKIFGWSGVVVSGRNGAVRGTLKTAPVGTGLPQPSTLLRPFPDAKSFDRGGSGRRLTQINCERCRPIRIGVPVGGSSLSLPRRIVSVGALACFRAVPVQRLKKRPQQWGLVQCWGRPMDGVAGPPWFQPKLQR